MVEATVEALEAAATEIVMGAAMRALDAAVAEIFMVEATVEVAVTDPLGNANREKCNFF